MTPSRAPSSEEVRRRWQTPGTGSWYDANRWSRNRDRDPRTVGRLLGRFLATGEDRPATVLDAPCGTGRLRSILETHGRFTGLDASLSMLRRAAEQDPAGLLVGDVEHLPFPDRTFDAVVACRLLHHLRTAEQLERAVSELVRVSRDLFLASFWDAGSLDSVRRRLPLTRRPRHRGWHPKSAIRAALAGSGAEVLAWSHGLRFVSQQTWFVARRFCPANGA